jgi:hypothetical protein
MRDRKQGVPYREPIIRAEYVGMREIAKRLNWSVNRVYREKRRNPIFPIFRRATKGHWNYVMSEHRLHLWQLATEMEATEHIRTTRTGEKGRASTRGPATGDSPPSEARMPSPPREGELEPVSHEPTQAAQAPEVSEAPTPVVVPCTCRTPVKCWAH